MSWCRSAPRWRGGFRRNVQGARKGSKDSRTICPTFLRSSGGRCRSRERPLPASYETAGESGRLSVSDNSATTAHVENPDLGYWSPEGSWEPQVSFSSFCAKAKPGSAFWRSLSPTVPALPVLGTGKAGMSEEGPPGEKGGRGWATFPEPRDRPVPTSARGSLGARAHPPSSPALCGGPLMGLAVTPRAGGPTSSPQRWADSQSWSCKGTSIT